jgi:hypothetical protein
MYARSRITIALSYRAKETCNRAKETCYGIHTDVRKVTSNNSTHG